MLRLKCKACGEIFQSADPETAQKSSCPSCGTPVAWSKPAKRSIRIEPDAPEPPLRPEPQPAALVQIEGDTWRERLMVRFITLPGWILCGLGTLGIGVLFIKGMASAKSAPQEASTAAACSFMCIALYVLARCWDKIVRG